MSTMLAKYEAAKRALAEARSVDEAKKVHDIAKAIEAFAKVADDKQLIADAHEIKKRAKRRIGELMKQQKETVGLNKGTAGSGRPKKGGSTKNPPKDTRPSLESQGINKALAHSARKEAAKPKEQFEAEIKQDKERIAAPSKPKVVNKKPKPEKAAVIGSAVDQCIASVKSRIEGTLRQLKRSKAKDEKLLHLFAALEEVIDDLKRKTFPTAEQSTKMRREIRARHAEEENQKLADASPVPR
jgi:hypothetical protein